MSLIVEKSNRGLYENEIEISGKYAKYLRFFKEDIGLFETFREAYVTATIIGCVNEIRGIDTSEENKNSISIFANDLASRKRDLKFLYRVIMLWNDFEDKSIEKYMDRTFRFDSDESKREELKANMKLVHRYTLNGIKILYEQFKTCNNKEEVCEALYDFVNIFEANNGLKGDEGLPELKPDFT